MGFGFPACGGAVERGGGSFGFFLAGEFLEFIEEIGEGAYAEGGQEPLGGPW